MNKGYFPSIFLRALFFSDDAAKGERDADEYLRPWKYRLIYREISIIQKNIHYSKSLREYSKAAGRKTPARVTQQA